MGYLIHLFADLDPVEDCEDDFLLEAGLIALGVTAIGGGIYLEMKHDLSGRLVSFVKGDDNALPFDVKEICLKGEVNNEPVKVAALATAASALTKEQRKKLEELEIDPNHISGRSVPATASEARKVLDAVGIKTDKGYAERWSNLSGKKDKPLTQESVEKAVEKVMTNHAPTAPAPPAPPAPHRNPAPAPAPA